MKKYLLIISMMFTNSYSSLSVEQIHDMVIKIHEKREGIQLETLEDTKEPFVRLIMENNVSTFQKPKKLKNIKLILHALLNGKAYINDKWYSVEDSIVGYTLKFVGKKGVILRNENKIKKLFLNRKKDKFIIFEEKE